ncbi:unnamed protein product [Phytophthora fragariaefolia]|uniref:Unnamed protein product n=1 Tax=Phytophthora fragariaefolia TaxID=1490495 RepID=A0A9W6WWQ3_9STRA|nr:unnamed protein product [Phytophthora fragariaefolia]
MSAGIRDAGGCEFRSAWMRVALVGGRLFAASWRRSCGEEALAWMAPSRRLTSGQVDRTLRVFATADTIDLSSNEIDKIPMSIPAEVVTLDISFNAIANLLGIERLKFVQELHLAFNRLDDVSALEFCPRLVRVNLSGNRYGVS